MLAKYAVVFLKAPIHEATLLLATGACYKVAKCMMRCCAVACCLQQLRTNRHGSISRQQLPKRSKSRLFVASLNYHVVYTRWQCRANLVPAEMMDADTVTAPEAAVRDPAKASTHAAENSSFRWTAEHIDELITLYEDRPCLYNTKSRNYFNRDLRGKALEEIGTAMGINGKPTLDQAYDR